MIQHGNHLNLPGPAPPPEKAPGADMESLLNPARVLSMEEYATLIEDIPIATASQRADFVEYVSTAHDWYKCLPFYPPGGPFYLYINKFAGCEYQCGFFVERKEAGCHYSSVATAEYRRRFGFLSYCPYYSNHATLLDRKGPAVPWDELAASLGRHAQLSALPKAILDAGRVELTAVIHPSSHSFRNWDRLASRAESEIYWPEESGGEKTLKRIFERCAAMRQPEYNLEENRKKRWEVLDALRARGEIDHGGLLDPVMHELLKPERERQKMEMVKAIDRIYRLVHEALNR